MKSRHLLTLGLISFLFGCGDKEPHNELDEIKTKLEALSVITGSLDSVVRSDFASCPASGQTADPLIRKICQVAQAATIEMQVELQNQLANAVTALNGEIDAINSDLISHQASLVTINATLTTLLADVALLDSRLDSAESAIIALQNLTNSISSALSGTMQSVTIGEELVSAGPAYEILLRRQDKKQVVGYVQAYGPSISLANNAVDPTNGSATVTITSLAAHGLSLGDTVQLQGIGEGSGFSSGHVYGEFTVTNVLGLTFDVVLPVNATSGTTFGGNVGTAKKLNGRGMSALWVSDQVSDSAVRVTSAGSQSYNFIIRRIASDLTNDTAEICYSKISRTATFATINVAPENGNATIACR